MAVGMRVRNAKGEVTFDSTYQKVMKQKQILTIPNNSWGSANTGHYSQSEGISPYKYFYDVSWLDPAKHLCLDQACWIESGRLYMHTTRAKSTWQTEFVIYEF